MRSSIISFCLIFFLLKIYQSEAVRKRSRNHNNNFTNQRKVSNSKHARGLIRTSTGDGLYRGYKLTKGRRGTKLKIWKQNHQEGRGEEVEFHNTMKTKVKKNDVEDHDALKEKKNGGNNQVLLDNKNTDSPTTRPTTLPTQMPTAVILTEEPDDSSNRFKLDPVDDGSTNGEDERKKGGPRILSNWKLSFLGVILLVGAVGTLFFVFFVVPKEKDEDPEMDEDDKSRETSPPLPNHVEIISA